MGEYCRKDTRTVVRDILENDFSFHLLMQEETNRAVRGQVSGGVAADLRSATDLLCGSSVSSSGPSPVK